MLACARLGAVHSVVFGGFASRELAMRIDDARPKVMVSASCGIEVQRVIEYKPLLERAPATWPSTPPPRAWCSSAPRPRRPCWPGATSTGTRPWPPPSRPGACRWPPPTRSTCSTPRAPPRGPRAWCATTAGTRWRCGSRWRTSTTPAPARCSGRRPTSAGWWATPTSSTRPCITGCTTILYEGKPVGTPDPGAFWRVISQHGVKTLFTAPTAFRAIKKEDPEGEHLRRHDISGFRCLFLAGERLDPDTYHWADDLLGVPVIDHWWQTETGWPVAANCMGLERLPVKPGSPTKPVPGYDVRILDSEGAPAPALQEGSVVIGLPLPPGTLPTLWHDDDRYVESYLDRQRRLLHHRRRRLLRRGRLPLRDGAHRRRAQRRRPPAVHRGDGGGGRRAPRRGRVRGHRRGRRAEGPGPGGPGGAEGRRRPRPRGRRSGSWCGACARRSGRWRA